MSIEPTRPPFPPPPPPAPVRAARAAMDATLLEMGAEPLDETARTTSRGAPEIGTRPGSATRSPQAAPRDSTAPPRVVRGEADHGPEFRTPTDRARAALLAGDPSAALEALETQTAGDLLDPEARAAPRSPVAHGLRAQARLDQGEPVAAFDAAARGLAEAPRSLALRWTAAQAAAALGAPDAAAALLAPLVDAAEAAVAERARRDAAPNGTNGSAGRPSPEGGDAHQASPDPAPAGTGSRLLLARPAATVALARRDVAPPSSDIRELPAIPTRDSPRDAPNTADPRITRHVARHRPGAQAYAAAAALETMTPDASNGDGGPAPARVPATTRAALLRLAGGIVAHLGDGSGADGVALFARDAAKRLDGGQGIGEPVREPEATPAASPSESSVDGSLITSKPDGAMPRAPRAPSANATSAPPDGPITPLPSEGMSADSATATRRSDVVSAAPTPTDASVDERLTAPTDEPQRTTPSANAPTRSAAAASPAPLPKTSLPEPYAAAPAVLDAPVLWRGDRIATASGTGDGAHAPHSMALPDASDRQPAAASTSVGGTGNEAVAVPGNDVADATAAPAIAMAMDRDALLTALPDDVRRAAQDGTAPLLLEESVRRAVGLPARREPDEAARPASTTAASSERASGASASASASAEAARVRPEPFASLAPGDRTAPHFVAWLAADLASGALPLPPQPPPPIEVFELASDPAGSAARAAAAAQVRVSPSALPVTWRGVLRLAVIGAGLVLLAGGRPMLGAAMTAGAVWWWLGDARRTARQATWSTRPTIE